MANCKTNEMSIADRLVRLGISLPEPTAPVATFVPWVRTGNLVFLSGHIARRGGAVVTGRLGEALTTADGVAAARAVAVDLLATLHAAAGSLDRVTRIVKLMVMVNSGPAYTEQHLVANGASELIVAVFGERGTHARSAFGVTQVPLGSCVEIELIAELGSA
jgi:enamine deaminase RidA (YjgF/YER057c/UK114 family)